MHLWPHPRKELSGLNGRWIHSHGFEEILPISHNRIIKYYPGALSWLKCIRCQYGAIKSLGYGASVLLELLRRRLQEGLLENLSFYFILFFYGCTCSTWKFPGQGSNQSCSCRTTNTTATATQDLSHIYASQILNPLSEARDQTPVLTDTLLVFLEPADPQMELPEVCHLKLRVLTYYISANNHWNWKTV